MYALCLNFLESVRKGYLIFTALTSPHNERAERCARAYPKPIDLHRKRGAVLCARYGDEFEPLAQSKVMLFWGEAGNGIPEWKATERVAQKACVRFKDG